MLYRIAHHARSCLPCGFGAYLFFEKKGDTITVLKRRAIASCECCPSKLVQYHVSCGEEVAHFCCGIVKVMLRMSQCSRCAIWIFLPRACTSCGKVLRFMWQGRDILILDRTSRQVVCTCGNASHVTYTAFSNAVFGSFCRIPRDTYSIFLLRICVCELNSEHVYPAHICALCFVFVCLVLFVSH